MEENLHGITTQQLPIALLLENPRRRKPNNATSTLRIVFVDDRSAVCDLYDGEFLAEGVEEGFEGCEV